MKRFIVLDKKVGETPLAAIGLWKNKNPEYADTAACYAGRLDPMASGKLLILLGDECKRQRAYTNLDKEYEIEVLLDVGSDTGDALGMPEYSHKEVLIEKRNFADILHRELGAHLRKYPAFSSKTVNGKPLFLYSLEGTLSHTKVPEHIEHIYRIRSQSTYTISATDLETRISKFLDCVPRTNEPSKKLGENFRVDAIRERWTELFKTIPERKFIVLRVTVVCASGTYMRSLASRIGTALESKALALSIKRKKIGTYIPLLGSIGFWLRTYR